MEREDKIVSKLKKKIKKLKKKLRADESPVSNIEPPKSIWIKWYG